MPPNCFINFMNQVSLLKSIPLRLYANILAFNGIPLSKGLDWTNVSQFFLVKTDDFSARDLLQISLPTS